MNFRLIFVCVSLLRASKGQETKEEEVNPFVEAARSLLQDSLQNKGNGGLAQGLGAVGGMIQGFMQTEGGRQIGDMLTGGGKGNDLLSGLGSLLTAQGSQRSAGGIDPQLIGQMVDMFAGKGDVSADEKDNEVQGSAKQGLDWESMISFATNMMASQNGGGNGAMEGFLNLLPVLMQSVNGGHVHQEDPELEDVQEHKRHQQASSFLPPFLSHLYVYWEHFKASELGQTLWTNSGLGAIMQLFTDKDGRFQVDRIFESMENTSFRKRWIRSLTSFIAEWVKYVSDPATQKRYLSTMQFVGNGFLKAQGYSKAVLFDPIRPAESLSLLANAVFKRQFGLKVDSAKYIKPAVAYIQDVFRLGQSKGLSLTHLTSQDIEGKLAETLNSEVIEPILRVWRAYRYAVKAPQCDRYLICTINRHPAAEKPGQLKPGVTKLASLTASWFLSGHTGTPFWKLYNAAVDENNCAVKYPVDCSGFHEEDIRVTTEYSHSEL